MKKSLLLLTAFLTFCITSAQTVGDTFTEGDYSYTVTSISPFEAELSGSTLTVLDVPSSATDSSNSTVYSITAVGSLAFHQIAVTSVILPSTVTTIGLRAFRKSGLSSINLENVITLDDKDVFSECSLATVDVSLVTYFGNYAFYKNTSLTAIEIPAATYLGEGAFRQTGISEIVIPGTVTSIGKSLFRGCASLTAIELDWANDANILDISTLDIFNSISDASVITVYVPVNTKALYKAKGWDNSGAIAAVNAANAAAVLADPGAVLAAVPSLINIVEVLVVGNTFTDGDYNYIVTSVSPNEVDVKSPASTPLPVQISIPATATDGEATVFDVKGIAKLALYAKNGGYPTPTSIVVAEGVTSIKESAFNNLANVTDVTLPSTITEIVFRAFRQCEALENITLPVGLTAIGDQAFMNCFALDSINIPTGVTALGDSAFKASGLTAIEILSATPPTLTSDPFEGVSVSGVVLTVPAGSSTAYTASDWSGFTISEADLLVGDTFTEGDYNYKVTSVFPNEVTLTGTTNAALTAIVVPATATSSADSKVYPVTSVGTHVDAKKFGAFIGNTVIETVSLPSSVTVIGSRAFQNASSLQSINLENVVETLVSPFSGCGNLSSIGVLTNLTTIGNYSFYQCHNLLNIEIPAATNIGIGGVYDMDGITRINIPSSVTTAGKLFLGRNNSLKEVQVNWAAPSDVTIGTDNFFRDLDLSTITLFVPIGTKATYAAAALWSGFPIDNIVEGVLPAIGDAFTEGDYTYSLSSVNPYEVTLTGTTNAALTAIVVPATATNSADSKVYPVTSVGTHVDAKKFGAFIGNTVIETVSLPSSVTVIGSRAFQNASSLQSINLENVVETLVSPFSGCGNLSSIGVLTNLTTIGNYSFYQCDNLLSLEIPAATNIGIGGVYDMDGITSINIPSSVTIAGKLFLGRNDGLKAVQVNWADPSDVTIGTDNFFRDLDLSTITLFVPTGTKATYAAAALWSGFPIDNIVEGDLVLSTNNAQKDLGFSIYPNPTNGIVTINNSKQENMTITIYDINGRTLLTTTKSKVDISNLASGIYVFKIATKNGEVVKRILKQ